MTKPGFEEKRMALWRAQMEKEFDKNVGDEGLFPNHTDKDIWMSGFEAGYGYFAAQTLKAENSEDFEEEMNIVQTALKESEDWGLHTEIVTWALKYMKDDPSLTIGQAITMGYLEWMK